MRESLVGQKFGRLTVIEDDGTRTKCGRVKYLCKCDCGNTKHVSTSNLHSGNVKSCGCIRKDILKAQSLSLIGNRFGKLTVIEDTGERNRRAIVYLCSCDCGKKIKVTSKSLREGVKKSCGCLQKGSSKEDFAMLLGRVEGTALKQISSEKLRVDNTSGITGVSWNKSLNKWRASIGFKGQRKHLGYFGDKQDAINARKEAEEKYFKPILEKYDK